MVTWRRAADGVWSFDYAVFDAWVEFARARGVTGGISCYSMLPWGQSGIGSERADASPSVYRFIDDAYDPPQWAEVKVHPSDDTYEHLWSAFLPAFQAHVEEKGWVALTAIAVDERPPEEMRRLLDIKARCAPLLRTALAGHNHLAHGTWEEVHNWSIYPKGPIVHSTIAARTAAGLTTTYYVCCDPPAPNTFLHSPPREATWLLWYAAAQGFTGFLRWAADSWTEDPLASAKHGAWAAGDCYLVYPQAQSSVRFEMLREGVQAFEKIRLLREAAAGAAAATGEAHVELRGAVATLDATLGRLFTLPVGVDAVDAALAEGVAALARCEAAWIAVAL